MDAEVVRPLPPGTRIEYCGIPAEVVADDGGQRIDVLVEGDSRQRWYWTFEGESCKVVEPK